MAPLKFHCARLSFFLHPQESAMFKNWFSSLVAAAVLIILISAGGNAVMGLGFDALSVAFAVSMLLMISIVRQTTARRRKPQATETDVESTHVHPVRRKRK